MALIERHLFGGACVNTGCIPTKTLVTSAYAAHLARRGADYGVMHDAPLRIDMVRVRARAVAVSANARAGVERWLRGMEGWSSTVTLLLAPDSVRVGDQTLKARRRLGLAEGEAKCDALE